MTSRRTPAGTRGCKVSCNRCVVDAFVLGLISNNLRGLGAFMVCWGVSGILHALERQRHAARPGKRIHVRLIHVVVHIQDIAFLWIEARPKVVYGAPAWGPRQGTIIAHMPPRRREDAPRFMGIGAGAVEVAADGMTVASECTVDRSRRKILVVLDSQQSTLNDVCVSHFYLESQ